MTTVENVTVTPVEIGGTRGGPDVPTLRQDRWWLQPAVTATVLISFVVYSTWAAFVNKDYYVGATATPGPALAVLLAVPGRQLRARQPPQLLSDAGGTISPALLILIVPARLPAHLLLLPAGLLPLDLALAPQLRGGRRPRHLHR